MRTPFSLKVTELPFSEALIVADSLPVNALVAVKVAAVEPAGTVTEDRIATEVLFVESATKQPPPGAGVEMVTVHVRLH